MPDITAEVVPLEGSSTSQGSVRGTLEGNPPRLTAATLVAHGSGISGARQADYRGRTRGCIVANTLTHALTLKVKRAAPNAAA